MNVAFIPVRGGSKSIPLKNIKLINGRPLVYWTVRAACKCEYIDKVYIATDCDIIKNTVEEFIYRDNTTTFSKAVVIDRSNESALDTASTEFAMLEFASQYNFNNIVLIQATSPLLTSEDLDMGFKTYAEKNVDSVLSVVAQKRFHWKKDNYGFSYPENYDIFNRPRRQNFESYYVENGAFYISSKEALIKSRNRISGNIKTVEMSEDTFFEIDEPADWIIVEDLMKKREIKSSIAIPEIALFLTDCDGCLTDSGMYYTEFGDEIKKFNTHDGMGFDLLHKEGIITGIITSENVSLIERRAKKLKLDILETNCTDKASAIKKICADKKIPLEKTAYVGDDINDIEAIKIVGYGCAPANAVPQVKEIAKYVTKVKGGEGAIREIIDNIVSSSKSS